MKLRVIISIFCSMLCCNVSASQKVHTIYKPRPIMAYHLGVPQRSVSHIPVNKYEYIERRASENTMYEISESPCRECLLDIRKRTLFAVSTSPNGEEGNKDDKKDIESQSNSSS